MKTKKSNFGFITAVLILAGIVLSCGQLKNLVNKENKLYFCERYDPVKGEINEAKKFTTGALTVMVDLRPSGKKMGVKEVDINITGSSPFRVGKKQYRNIGFPNKHAGLTHL